MGRAVVATGYGGPEVLEVVDVEAPQPGHAEVVVDVRAAGVNPADRKSYDGTFGTDAAALPKRLGSEVAGVVSAVGAGVDRFAVGDEVIAYRVVGGYAEQVLVGEEDVFLRPQTLTAEQAAGLLLTGVTAAHLLHATAVAPGETVLLHGASGGVGSAAVQLLVHQGARVIGTAGPGRQDDVRELGGEPVPYGDGLLERVRDLAPDGVDVALDAVGTDEAVDVSLALVPDRDRIATVAAFARAPGLGIRLLGGGPGADPGTQVRSAARATLVALAAEGRMTVQVDRTFALDDVRAAHAHLASGTARGKVVLVP